MNIINKLTHNVKIRVTAAALIVAGLTAQAHPGHSLHEASVSHYVTSPYHLIVLSLVGLALCGAAFVVSRPVLRRALATGGAAALLIAVILWQMPA